MILVEYKKGKGRQPHRWVMKALNGEIVATGEGHTRPADAERAVLHIIEEIRAGAYTVAIFTAKTPGKRRCRKS